MNRKYASKSRQIEKGSGRRVDASAVDLTGNAAQAQVRRGAASDVTRLVSDPLRHSGTELA